MIQKQGERKCLLSLLSRDPGLRKVLGGNWTEDLEPLGVPFTLLGPKGASAILKNNIFYKLILFISIKSGAAMAHNMSKNCPSVTDIWL